MRGRRLTKNGTYAAFVEADPDGDVEYTKWLREVGSGPELFDTPEEAALAGWRRTPSARARVVEVRQNGDTAIVMVEVDGGTPGFHDCEVYTCERTRDGKWSATEGIGAD